MILLVKIKKITNNYRDYNNSKMKEKILNYYSK